MIPTADASPGYRGIRSRATNGCARSVGGLLRTRLARDQAAKAEAHGDLVQAAVQVLHQALAEADVGLAAREQVLHDGGKPGAAARELHHAGRDRSQHELAEEHAAGEAGAELQIGGEIAAEQA